MLNERVTVNSRKYDLSIRRTWHCRLIERKDPLLVFVGEFDSDVGHPDLGLVAKGTVSYEYYWLDRWYNIFRFHEPNGSLRNFYCNINMPPTFQEGVLDYVDLDIDIVVWPDGRIRTLDAEEFDKNLAIFDYPTAIIGQTRNALTELMNLIESRQYPFDVESIEMY